MKSSVQIAKPEHEVAYQEICDLIKRQSQHLTSFELLAIAANMVGKLVALQDQRVVTPEMAMETVAKNLEIGNQQALHEFLGKPQGEA